MSRITIYKHEIFVARKKKRYPVTQCGVIFIKDGHLTYQTKQNETRRLNAGEFTIYHSDQLRDLESHVDDNGYFSSDVITFEPSLFRQFCDTLDNALPGEVAPHELNYALGDEQPTAKEILLLLIKAKKSNQSTDATLEALAQALIYEMLTVEPSFLPLVKSACNQNTAQKVIGFIELNIENDVSLETTAHFLGMSIATLKRRLAAEDLSFSQILKVKRVNHAATKLRLSNKSIAEIAFESGFKSAAHFSTAFKGVQGMTPKEFRQHIAKNK